mgnify:CR=1 FL=1
MNSTIVAISAGYFGLMIVIGLWAARRTKTASDFFVAGKGVGLVAIALATMSSAMSGFLFIGGPGIQYQFGFGTLMLTMPAAVSFARPGSHQSHLPPSPEVDVLLRWMC